VSSYSTQNRGTRKAHQKKGPEPFDELLWIKKPEKVAPLSGFEQGKKTIAGKNDETTLQVSTVAPRNTGNTAEELQKNREKGVGATSREGDHLSNRRQGDQPRARDQKAAQIDGKKRLGHTVRRGA